MNIINIAKLSQAQHEQAAQMLHDAFPHAWSSLGIAQQELDEIMQNCDDGQPEILAAMHGDEVIGFAGMDVRRERRTFAHYNVEPRAR